MRRVLGVTRRLLLVAGVGLGLAVLPVPLPGVQITEQAVGATVRLPAAVPVEPEDLAEVQAAADEPLGDDRVEATDEQVEEFALMAVVFDTPPTDPVMVRVKNESGGWDRWQELHVAPDEGPDDPTNFGTEPFWVDSSDGYEVNLGTDDSQHAEVVLVRNELRKAVTVTERVAGAEGTAPYAINTRASWQARPRSGFSYGSSIKKGIVHHTVSSNSYSPAQVPGIIRGIQAYHIDGRGWNDIGYNFLVDKYGKTWEGRGGGMERPVVGAHASGWNTNTVGVSVIGDYTNTSSNSAINEAVAKVLGWKLFLGGQEPTASSAFTSGGGPRYPAGQVVVNPNIVGHGDVGSTACPGGVRNSFGWIRTRAQQWTDHFKRTLPKVPPVGEADGFLLQKNGVVTVAGWAAIPGDRRIVNVALLLDNKTLYPTTPGIRRPDVAAREGLVADNIGFRGIFTAMPGKHRVCAYAENFTGPSVNLGCHDFVK